MTLDETEPRQAMAGETATLRVAPDQVARVGRNTRRRRTNRLVGAAAAILLAAGAALVYVAVSTRPPVVTAIPGDRVIGDLLVTYVPKGFTASFKEEPHFAGDGPGRPRPGTRTRWTAWEFPVFRRAGPSRTRATMCGGRRPRPGAAHLAQGTVRRFIWSPEAGLTIAVTIVDAGASTGLPSLADLVRAVHAP